MKGDVHVLTELDKSDSGHQITKIETMDAIDAELVQLQVQRKKKNISLRVVQFH